MSLDGDLAILLADAATLGMADAATYVPTSGASVVLAAVAIKDVSIPYLHGEGAEIHRSEIDAVFRRTQVISPGKGDQLVIATGAHAGTWTATEVTNTDAICWVVRFRFDEREAMGTARRMP